MKKIAIVVVIVLVIGIFVVLSKMQGTTTSKSSLNLVAPSPAGNSGPNVSYKDGTYTGVTSNASVYGNVQVQAIITGGKITDIKFLQFPDRGGHTQEVTQMAEPILKQEAIAVQSAKIDFVSGATQDTQAFIESLQSALDQAKI